MAEALGTTGEGPAGVAELLARRPRLASEAEGELLPESPDQVRDLLRLDSGDPEYSKAVDRALRGPPGATSKTGAGPTAGASAGIGNGDRQEGDEALREVAKLRLQEELRERRVNELEAWQREAADRLEGAKADNDAARDPSVAQLLEALAATSGELARLHAESLRWGASKAAAREALQLGRKLAETDGRPPGDPAPYLLLTEATFMTEGNTPELRETLAEARRLVPGSSEIARRLAEYDLMAGDYDGAREAIRGLEADPDIAQSVLPRVDPKAAATAPPENVHPSNFYTYRTAVRSDAALNELGIQFAALREITDPPGVKVPPEFRELWTAATAAVGTIEAEFAPRGFVDDESIADRAGRSKFESRDAGVYVGDSGPTVERAASSERRTDVGSRRRAGSLISGMEDRARDWIEEKPVMTIGDLREAAVVGGKAVDAWLAWSRANSEFRHGRYASAARAYAACQLSVLAYLHATDSAYRPPESDVVDAVVAEAKSQLAGNDVLRTAFTARVAETRLDDLRRRDWTRPAEPQDGLRPYASAPEFVRAYSFRRAKIEENVTVPLLAVALIFAPLGAAEALVQRGDFEQGTAEYERLLDVHDELSILSELIEVPFIKLMQARLLVANGDHLYRSGRADVARATYEKVAELFQDDQHKRYVEHFDAGVDALRDSVETALGAPEVVADPDTGEELVKGVNLHPLALAKEGGSVAPLSTPSERQALSTLGMNVPVDSIEPRSGSYPDASRDVNPTEPLLSFTSPQSNPALWEALSLASARIAQIAAGFNFLGYRQDFAPRWHFSFLLDRARYFAEHAKSARRDYLNFLSTAENEEFRELGAAQAVTLEKGNIRIENARVEQARLEGIAANTSKGLADLAARNAAERLRQHGELQREAESAQTLMMIGSIVSLVGSVAATFVNPLAAPAALGQAAGLANRISMVTIASGGAGRSGPDWLGAGGAAVAGAGDLFAQWQQQSLATREREFERQNLLFAFKESEKAALVAAGHLDVAKQALVAATLQHGAALLRHDFAVQNLSFLTDRTLNAEVWYRLAQLIKGVSDAYLRSAIELAFLAEQVAELQAGEQLNVIRFDYETPDAEGMVAADRLLRDIDTLEEHLVVKRRQREQHVRCTVSLARDFPHALARLRETGKAVVTIPLRLLEERFPGLFNLRVGAVDVMPIALMDPTRFSLQLTYMGTSQVRLTGPSEAVPGSAVESWLPEIDNEWPVRMRISDATTVVYSGLSRAEEQSTFAFEYANQRNAYEGIGAACSWHIDLATRANRIDPRSLADLLLTLDLSAYDDPILRLAVEKGSARPQVLTQHLSAGDAFPDAFYEFQQSGRLLLDVDPHQLAVESAGDRLRNVSLIGVPAARPFNFDPLRSAYRVDFTVAEGDLTITSVRPKVKIEIAKLNVTLTIKGLPAGATATVDFGDGTPPKDRPAGGQLAYEYAESGRYSVTLRVGSSGRATEFKADLAVAADEDLVPPETAFPQLDAKATLTGRTRVSATAGGASPSRPVLPTWALVDRADIQRGSASFDLEAGSYTLLFCAVRTLKGRVKAGRRAFEPEPVALEGLGVSTNREFDASGKETGERNALATQLFGEPPEDIVLSPADRWSLELKGEDNDFLRSTDDGDPRLALDVFDDVLVGLEYDVIPARAAAGALPAATVALDPPELTVPVGTEHRVTALVGDPLRQPVPNSLVRFKVSGANQASGFAVTDELGRAPFAYTGATVGSDRITAFVDLNEDEIRDADEPMTVASCERAERPPKALSLTPSSPSHVVGADYEVTASVIDTANEPMANVSVRLTCTGVNPRPEVEARTDADGRAVFPVSGDGVGKDILNAYVDTNANAQPDPAEPKAQAEHVYLLRPAASIVLDPADSETHARVPATVTALVTDALAAPVRDVPVQFNRSGANGGDAAAVQTDENGKASYTYTGSEIGEDTIEAYADTNGNGQRDIGEPIAAPARNRYIAPPASIGLEGSASAPRDRVCIVKARVFDALQNPVVAVPARFERSGANGPDRKRVLTDEEGCAPYGYTPRQLGVDTVEAYADTNDNDVRNEGEPIAQALKVTIVTPQPSAVTIEPVSGSSHALSERAVLVAVVDDLGLPVPGARVRFEVSGSNPGAEAKDTDAHGQTAFSYAGKVGTDTLTVYADLNTNNKLDATEPRAAGSHTFTVPSLFGREEVFTDIIEAAGLELGTVTTLDPGKSPVPGWVLGPPEVVDQSPAPGTASSLGATVDVTVQRQWRPKAN